jgi:hypothetical protein
MARQLGCTKIAVQIARKRNGIASRSATLLSARAVQERLGLGCSKTVTRWIKLGWLAGKRGQQVGPYRMWYVTEDALLTFLEDPAYWHVWQPERITDRHLRLWAIEERSYRYLSVGEVAKRFCVGYAAVNNWISRGLLPAKKYGNWWIRDCDLTGFVAPNERSRVGTQQSRFSPDEDAKLLQLRAEGMGWTAIARLLNHPISSVFGRAQRLAAVSS